MAPGVGFGPGGEGFVRFALVEPDDRATAACAAIGKFLAGPPLKPRFSGLPWVDKGPSLQ